ncbi:MAG: aldehyde dehydrogenase family protein [Pseudomonadota bacterium]
MVEKFENYIDGAWRSATSYSQNINPSNTDDIVGEYAQASEADLNDAVRSAKEAFAEWSLSGLLQRHEVLSKTAHLIRERKNDLGRLLSREEGKTLPEGIGEVMRAAQVFDFFAGEVLRLSGEKLASVRPNVEVEVTREPLGVIGIITPWNFPIAIPAWKMAPALAYGNSLVIKPANLAPACTHALIDILVEAGAPKGVVNLVMGSGRVVGQAMVDHPDIEAITFTGSDVTGKNIAESCVRSGKKVQAEMGGKNPLVVLDDANLDTAVECALNGAYFSTGQRCTASSRLIVEKGIYDDFVKALQARIDGLTVGDALAEGTHIGPLADESQLQKSLSYVEIGQEEGARLVCGGEEVKTDTPGYFLKPALFADVKNDMRIAQEEIFGPVACAIKAEDFDHALTLANDTEFGLSSGICTTSLEKATKFKRQAQAGMVMVNLPTAGVDFHVPFGGRKGSSYGPREQGRYAAEFYTTVKTSYIGV